MTRSPRRRAHRAGRFGFTRTVLVLVLALAMPAAALADTQGAGGSAAAAADIADHPALAPVDAQNWVDMADLTWDDYRRPANERPEFYDHSTQGSQNQYRTAVILLQFTDQPMLITQEPGSHPFGNPQPGWEPVAPEDVNDWYQEYFDTPNVFNGYNSMHSYWMETTHGRIGVDADVFGPYTLPGKLHEYGIPDGSFNAPTAAYCPQGDTCNRNLRTDGGALWRASIPGCTSGLCGYDNGFYVTAGHDESSTWQEFGEMLFETRDDVPDTLGPPRNPDGSPPINQQGNVMPNWANTRYVDWTSWKAAANHWPNASGGTSTQAESSGLSVFAHEFSHLRGLPDNYNNPFADTDRNYTGYWEMMSRGTFNGPGGTHNRWQVPNQGGAALGPHHTLHFKNSLNALAADEQVTLQRADLATRGVARVPIKARSTVPDGDLVGLTVNFGANSNLRTECLRQGIDPFYCPSGGNTNYLHYRVEVVDRVGNDSFTPGHGVLLTASRTSGTPRVWMVDPNPEDIGMIDYYRPDGTPVAVVRGDPRQLNDATFHAGTNSGSRYEYVDETTGLHFYIVDTYRDADGALFYDVAVRSLAGDGAQERGVALGTAVRGGQQPGTIASCTFPLTNTGEAGEGVHNSDVYRISASSQTAGWDVHLPNALAAAAAGETVDVPVHMVRTLPAGQTASVTLTATSESDPSQSATATCNVHVGQTADASFAELHAELDALVAAGGITPSLEAKIRHALEMAQEWLLNPRQFGPALSHLDRAVRLLEWQADVVERGKPNQGDPAGLRALAASIRSVWEDLQQ